VLEPIWNEVEIARLNEQKRKQAIRAVVTFKLDTAAQIRMTLIYLRQYCTKEFLSWMTFVFDRSN
jgi:hypothetical protein